MNFSSSEWLAMLAEVWEAGYQSAVDSCPYTAPHSWVDMPNPYRVTRPGETS